MKQKKYGICILVICLLILLTGCGDKRPHGKTHEGDTSTGMETSFFNCTVNRTAFADTYGGYVPESDQNTFVVVNVTVKNTFAPEEGKTDIPISCYDFTLSWGEKENESAVAVEPMIPAQLTEKGTLKKGESVQGDLVFVVPKDKNQFSLIYQELWNDDYKGDTYKIHFKLEKATEKEKK